MRSMTLEGKQRKAEMQYMKEHGFTLQQIGDKYGLSRERVRQIINDIHKKKILCGVKKICYPNAKRWAMDNGYSTLRKLSADMDMCETLVSAILVKGALPTKRSVRKITAFMGMSADEIFYLPDQVGKSISARVDTLEVA